METSQIVLWESIPREISTTFTYLQQLLKPFTNGSAVSMGTDSITPKFSTPDIFPVENVP